MFNRLLVDGGIMVHFSPMLDYIPVHGSHLDTAFHTNFFSKKSLQIICRKTGFEPLAAVLRRTGFWYYIFRKTTPA